MSKKLQKFGQKIKALAWNQKTKRPRLSIVIGGSLVTLWLLTSFVLLILSNGLIYKKERSYGIDLTIKYEQHFVRNKDGNNIDLIYMPSRRTKKLVLYLHGNSGRVPHFFSQWQELGFAVLSPAYPGFHFSEGEPNTQNIYETSQLAFDWAVQKGWPVEDIIIFGHSLGGSPAVHLASKEKNIDKLILVNTFSSIQSMCWDSYSIFCVFSGNILNTAKLADKVQTKVIQYAYEDDQNVPFEEGRKLYKAFSNTKSKKFIKLKGQVHSYFDMKMIMNTQIN